MKKIKTILLASSLMLATIVNVAAQDGDAFYQGKMIISLGYGAPNLNKSIFKTYDVYTGYKVTGAGPYHVKFEYAATDKFGIGISINGVNSSVSYKDTYDYKLNMSSIKANLRFNYHFVTTDRIDVYYGIGAGYGDNNFKWTSNDPTISSQTIPTLPAIGFESTVGVRGYFTDNIGIYSEIGLAKSIIQAGLVFKL